MRSCSKTGVAAGAGALLTGINVVLAATKLVVELELGALELEGAVDDERGLLDVEVWLEVEWCVEEVVGGGGGGVEVVLDFVVGGGGGGVDEVVGEGVEVVPSAQSQEP